MFNFIKKAGNTTQDDKERRKKDKKDRKDKQKRDRTYMTTEEVLRLDEVRRSLKLRGRRKEKEKLPSGITADYTASFLASLDRSESPSSSNQVPGSPNSVPQNIWGVERRSASISCTTTDGLSLTQSDSSETSLNSLNNPNAPQVGQKIPPSVPPRPPKRGILKGPKINVCSTKETIVATSQNGVFQVFSESSNELIRNTLQNELITYQNLPVPQNGDPQNGDQGGNYTLGNNLLVVTSTSPSNDSLTDTTTNSSFATPPFSLSPVAESQGFHRWSRTANFDDFNLPLPPVIKLILPKPRELKINRQPPPRNDFGFSLRRAMIVERNFENWGAAGTPQLGSPLGGAPKPCIQMKAVIFAEPGTVVQHNNETGLLPGDRLLEVNGIQVDDKTREEIIDLIKNSKESVTVKVQPVAELSELSRRSGQDGRQIELDDSNIRGGTLRRSGSRRFNRNGAKSDIELATEQSFLNTDKLWLVHRAGFTAAFRLAEDPAAASKDPTQSLPPGKLRVRLEETNEILVVDEDDIEKANPPQFDRVEDLAQLRYLNESSVLHTLRQRYAENLIHTYAGGNMLVVNPMAPLAIYSDKVVAMFKGCKSEDLPPHIFSMAQSSYHNMLQTRKDQSLVFLGRSGSGKTINFKHCIQYLILAAAPTTNTNTTNKPQSSAPSKFLTIEKLGAIWRILENFGNCKTQMNSNATRFTQIFSLDFDQSGIVASASIQILLLERSRIGKRLDNDSTFHIMYRMLAGVEGTLRRDLFLDAINPTEITNPFITPLYKHEDKQRAQEEYQKICQAFQLLQVSETDQKVIWMVLAAIWHLGCSGVAKISSGTPTHKYQFANPQCAQRAAHLLGTTVEDLSRHIFGPASGTPTAPRQPFRTPSPTDRNGLLPGGDLGALEALEAMLIGLYNEVFNAVAALINRAISQPTHTVSSILLIDCPGFQNPASCGRQTGATFEDLCHNYLQERLQLLFHQTNLVQPKDRYTQEGIECNLDEDESAGINPGPVVNLLDKSPQNTMLRTSQTDLSHSDRRGLFWLLDEEAIYPGSTDDTFLERLFTHYGDRESQLLLRKAPGNGQFVLQHLQGTNPVLYTANGWLKSSRENQVTRGAVGILQESGKEDVSRMFVSVRGVGPSSFTGSVVGIEGSQSLRRASSIRRTFTAGTAGIKRKSMSLQVKFTIDGLIETLRRTKLRFVQCLLPQHNAGLCESNTALLAVKSASGQAEDSVINVPLIRSQLRGFQTLDSVRLFKQGFPCFLPLGEFRRRFRLLAGENRPSSPVLDERKAVEDMLLSVDLDMMGYRVGMSQIFFRQQTLTHLESLRDNFLQDRVVALQSHCRGYLARKRLQQRRLQDLAVRCIQRNVRAFMAVRDWPWWRLMVRVAPVLGVVRQEEMLKMKTEELETLKLKLEKLEMERNGLKHENDKLEAKLSEITADLAEEHSTATLATERLDAETQERIRLERDLEDVKNKNRSLQQSSERLEMELLYARSDMNGLNSEEDEEGEQDGGVYKQRYERVSRELEFTRRRLQQQHEDDLEQLVGLKKQLEKKLADAYEEVEEQRQVVGQWKRKVQKLNAETNDLRLLLEEQNSRNNLLEKKQRKFDSETQLLHDELRQEKQAKERMSREKEVILAEKYTLDNNFADLRLELDLTTEKLHNLQREYDEITFGGKTEEEVTLLRKQKMELDRKLHEQEEELDELAGQTQLLEQAKLRLEMALEQSRKEAKRLATQSEDELEEVRCNAQKKLKALEAQLETEYEERTVVLREKHELERRLQSFHENERTNQAADEALLQRLKRDLRRTKALLRDAQTMLERQKADSPGKAVLRQLRNQLEDAECARQNAVKAKQIMEGELNEAQLQFEEAQRLKNEADSRANAANRERTELRTQLEENEEELAEVLKKYKSAVQQMSVDQLALQEQVSLVSELETERNTLKEQIAELNVKLESIENAGDASSNLMAKRLELRCKELESKLELEQTTRSRLEVQIARLKETLDKLQTELANSRTKEQQSQDLIRKTQRNMRELKDELSTCSAREAECLQKRKELEKRIETSEAETHAAKADLRLAMKRIEDLQSAIQGELEDTISDNSDSEADSYSSDESIETFLANHKLTPSKSNSSDKNSFRLDSSPN